MRLFKIFKNKKANSTPMTVAIILCLLIICCGITEYFRLMIIAGGIRDGLQQAVISVSVSNYYEVYNGLREGYSGCYALSDGSWDEDLNYGDVYTQMDDLLGTVKEGRYHLKVQGDGYEYRYSKLSVDIINAPFTPGNADNNFEADVSIQVEIPLSSGFGVLPPLKMEVRTKATYMPKF